MQVPIAQLCTPNHHKQDINGDSSHSDTQYLPHQQLHISWKRKKPGDTMNHTKTHAYLKHHESSRGLLAIIIGPEPWHTVLMAQNDKFILTPYNKEKYRLQAIANCHPCQFLCLKDQLIGLGLHLAWLGFAWIMRFNTIICRPRVWFLEHSNGLIDIERFVPLEDVDHKIHSHVCKCHDFEMCDWKVFDSTCDALHHEPQSLKEDKWFSKPVALPSVLDFCLGWYSKWGEVDAEGCVISVEVNSSEWMKWSVFLMWNGFNITRFFQTMLKEMESSHENKESVHFQPL